MNVILISKAKRTGKNLEFLHFCCDQSIQAKFLDVHFSQQTYRDVEYQATETKKKLRETHKIQPNSKVVELIQKL